MHWSKQPLDFTVGQTLWTLPPLNEREEDLDVIKQSRPPSLDGTGAGLFEQLKGSQASLAAATQSTAQTPPSKLDSNL